MRLRILCNALKTATIGYQSHPIRNKLEAAVVSFVSLTACGLLASGLRAALDLFIVVVVPSSAKLPES